MGKKDKKKKKSKKKSRKNSSSESSSESEEDMWVEKAPVVSTSKPTDHEKTKLDPFDQMFSQHASSRKELNEKNMKAQNADGRAERREKTFETELESTITSRELNPYWKDGGKGLPVESRPDFTSPKSHVNDQGHSFDKKGQTKADSDGSNSDSDFDSSYNKRKSNDVATKSFEKVDLNKLNAELLKAELMGDSSKIEELKKRIEEAKRSEKDSSQVMLTKIGPSGAAFPVLKGSSSSDFGHKKRRGKIETHDKDGKRVRYSGEGDNQSINEMLVREKSQTAANQNKALMKFMGGRGRGFETLDDMFVNAKAQKKSVDVEERMLEEDAKSEQRKALQTMDECYLCFNSSVCKQRLVVKSNEYCYISLPYDTALVKNHCLICPVLHYNCSTLLDEEVFDRIESEKRFLVERFSKLKKRVVFVETFRNTKKFYHMYIECIPMGRSAFSEAPMFFKKAILESEEEWSMNKKLVDLKNNDVRRTIPKGLSYFTVQFGLDPGGFAHVIEDATLFPRYFARQIVGGILDLDDFVIHRPKALSKEQQLENVERFKRDVLNS